MLNITVIISTSKLPDFLTHFMLQTNMTPRMISRTIPVGLAMPATSPKRPGLEVISQSQAVHSTQAGLSEAVSAWLVLSAQCCGGERLFSTKNETGSTSKLMTAI